MLSKVSKENGKKEIREGKSKFEVNRKKNSFYILSRVLNRNLVTE
jgi:hypothetical protein